MMPPNRVMNFKSKLSGYKKSKVIFSWIFSYSVVVVVLLILSGVMMNFATQFYVQEYKNMNKSIQKEIITKIENSLLELKKINSTIASDTKINSYIQYSEEAAEENYQTLINLADAFRSYSQYGGITEIYLYFSNMDLIVAPFGIVRKDLIKETVFFTRPFYDIDIDQFADHYYYDEITLLERENRRPLLMMMRSLPQDQYFHPRGMLFQVLSPDYVDAIFKSAASNPLMHCLLVAPDGRIITSDHPGGMSSFPQMEIFSETSGMAEIQHEDTEYYCFFEPLSAISGFHSVMLISKDDIAARMKPMNTGMLIFVIVSLLIETVLVFFLLKNNYKPVKKLLTEVSAWSGESSGNEFDEISSSIQNMIAENQNMHESNEKLTIQMQNRMMKSILRGHVSDNPEIQELLNMLNLTFTSKYFCVLIVACAGSSQSDLEKSLEMFGDELTMEISDIRIYQLALDRKTVCILNLSEDHYKDEYVLISGMCRRFAEDRRFFWSVSRICSGLGNVGLLYYETDGYMQQKVSEWKQDGMFMAEPTYDKDNLGNFGISIALEEQLQTAIRNGNDAEAMRLFRASMKDCRYSSWRSIYTQSFLYGIANVFWRSARQLQGGIKPYQDKIAELTDAFLKSTNEEEACKQMEKALKLLSNAYAQHQEPSDHPVVRRIIKLINEKYSDSNLTVTSLSEMIETNVTTVSKLFRATTGFGLHDYISRVRINHAVELLKTTNATVSEIAQKVGFDNLNSFTRTFKKYEGNTPSSLRNRVSESGE